MCHFACWKNNSVVLSSLLFSGVLLTLGNGSKFPLPKMRIMSSGSYSECTVTLKNLETSMDTRQTEIT